MKNKITHQREALAREFQDIKGSIQQATYKDLKTRRDSWS